MVSFAKGFVFFLSTIFFFTFFGSFFSAYLNAQTINTIAGTGTQGYNGDGLIANTAQLNFPFGVAVDVNGNTYIADQYNARIRKVDKNTCIISTIAGTGTAGYNADGISATTADLNVPEGIALDASGNVYVADSQNHRIRKITVSTGIISTIAGTGTAGYNGDGIAAVSAQLNRPVGVAVDVSGNVYIAEFGGNRIRKVDVGTGLISTIAGTGGGGFNGDGILATAANVYQIGGVALDGAGNVYIADTYNHRIRKVDIGTGLISTIAGTGTSGYNGDGITAITARLNYPYAITVEAGNVYIADYANHRIRKVDTGTGLISTIAGTGTAGYNGDGIAMTTAQLSRPSAIVFDTNGKMYIADQFNHRIRTDIINGCTPNNDLTAVTAQTNIACYGDSTGTGIVTPSLGTFPYTYLWSPYGGTDSIATGLIAGTYTVIVTDAALTTLVKTIIITQPSVLATTITSVSVSCNGNNTGIATAIASGGTWPYSYNWSNGQNGSTASNLSVGSYTVTITDNNGCSNTASTTINQPAPITLTVSASTSTCGQSDGSATVIASGGTGTYTYLWNTTPSLQTTATVTGLVSATYPVTVTDANGCTTSIDVQISNFPGVTGQIIFSRSVTCNGICTGQLTVDGTGGSPSYSFVWSSGKTESALTGLCAGLYTATVTDMAGCPSSVSFNLPGPPALIVSISSTSLTCNGDSAGTATVSLSGGISPYAYNWSTGASQLAIVNLQAAVYSITVTDNNGCSTVATIIITEPALLTLSVTAISGCGIPNPSASASANGGRGTYIYLWSNGSNQFAVSNLQTGVYSVTVTDANNCTVSNSVNIIASTITAAASGNVTIALGDNTVLSASGGGSYLWTPSAGLNCITCSNPTATPQTTTIYCVKVTDANGCTDTACVTVTVDTVCAEIFVPTAFSPNADSQNDHLCIQGISCITSLTFIIYNRWGGKVFETIRPDECWDGVYKNKKMNQGIFVYYLNATLRDKKTVTLKGNISIIR